MRRIEARLEEVADLSTIAVAFRLAARGKSGRPDVERFRADFDREIARVRDAILAGVPSLGPVRRFRIFDPKPRVIAAPCFRDRVLHHALMAPVAPVLDTISIDDSYACRPGKGALAAVRRAQRHHRRQAWRAQIDIDGYFASISRRSITSGCSGASRRGSPTHACSRSWRRSSAATKTGRGAACRLAR